MLLRSFLLFTSTVSLLALTSYSPTLAADDDDAKTAFNETRFVANKTKYKATTIEKNFINAWGIADRPAGAGGHFWVAAKDVSYEYVGDVKSSPDAKLRTLHTDKLQYVKLPVGGADNVATGVVFSDSKKDFVITQNIAGVEPVTAPAKFLFASDGGIISAWTERKKADGSFDRAPEANTVIDESKAGAQFFGLAISKDYDKIYAANFGKDAGIKVYGGDFKPANIAFDQPFDTNKNGKIDPGEYAPFNIQGLTNPASEYHLFVTYAKTQACNKEGLKKHDCKKGEMYVGEEDTDKPGQGSLAEFTEDGKLVTVWNDGGKLSAPWGIAFAPDNFGTLSNMLLVGNFGDGTIAAFGAQSHDFIDHVRAGNGKPVVIEKLWGLMFGNGASLGDTNALYFTAGPDDEKDGLFGVLRAAH